MTSLAARVLVVPAMTAELAVAVDADWIVQKIARLVSMHTPLLETLSPSTLEWTLGVFGNFALTLLRVARQVLALARMKT